MNSDRKVKVVDTSVLVHDPGCLNYLAQKGVIIAIPWTVLEELDGLKNRFDIGYDAREAIRNIEELRQSNEPFLEIIREKNWSKINFLDKKVNDHKIIATANALQKKYSTVELVSKDSMMRIKARELDFSAEDYYRDQAENNTDPDMPRIEVPIEIINMADFTFPVDQTKHDKILENEGVVCLSEWSGNFKRPDERVRFGEHFAAIKRKDCFKIIAKNIQAFGIHPYSGKRSEQDDTILPNWPQKVALNHLTDPDIALVFLEGGAGTGKTLLALAGALEKKSEYRQILVSRPMVHLEDKDNMGYLPGDIKEKMGPWLRPIWQNLGILKETDPKRREIIEKVISEKKLEIEPLDYIRGATFWRCYLIIDEAQNLTPHQVKTIITRMGEGSKLVFTGDLDQIDRKRRLDKRSSGLAYASTHLQNKRIVASVKFQESVRSELAKMGVSLL